MGGGYEKVSGSPHSTAEVGYHPHAIGYQFLPSRTARTTLRLRNQRVYSKSGIVGLEYDMLKAN